MSAKRPAGTKWRRIKNGIEYEYTAQVTGRAACKRITPVEYPQRRNSLAAERTTPPIGRKPVKQDILHRVNHNRDIVCSGKILDPKTEKSIRIDSRTIKIVKK